MQRFFISLLVLSLTLNASGQKFLKKLKDAVNDQLDIALNPVEENSLGDNRMESFRLDQLVKDTSNYNYIFSQGNRASFFANRDSKESLLLTLSKNYEDEEMGVEAVKLELYEEVFDLNRSGEKSIYINPKLAYVSFLEALSLLTSNGGFYENSLLDSVFSISSLVRMDTLSMPEKYALGKTIANISIVIHYEGKYHLSEDFINETIKYFKQEIGAQSIALAALYNNHAVISQSQGRYTDAENYFKLAEEILVANERNGTLAHAILTSNRSLLFNEIGQYEEAKGAIQNAMNMADGEIREKGRDNVSFQINQGLIFYSNGEYEKAEAIFNNVLELKRKRMAKNQTDYANVENYLAGTLMEAGKPDQVPELLNDALRIFEKKYGVDHPAYMKTEHNLGRYYLISSSFEEAKNTLNNVRMKYLQFYGPNHPDYLSSTEDLAVLAWNMGSHAWAKQEFKKVIDTNLELVEKYFGAMSEYEKGQYWSKVRPSILKFYAYAVARGNEDPELLTEMYTIHLKTKGILLSASTKVREQILNSTDKNLKAIYQKWVDTKEQLILYYGYSKQQLKDQSIDIVQLERNANQLEKELNRLSTDFAQANKLPSTTLGEVKSKLSNTSAAVEVIGYPVFERSFTRGKNYAFLIANLQSIHPKLVLIENGEDLDGKYAKAYRNMVQLKANDRITYDKFWKPVDEELAGYENVHLALDGIYYQVNIGALKKADGTYVADATNLHLYSSTRDLLKSKNTSFTSKKADFFGYPDYGVKGLVASLPGTKVEIEAVSQITRTKGFATNIFMQKEASEQNFKTIKSPSLLHIATHGFFLEESHSSEGQVFGVDVNQANENPLLRSGLMLADADQTMGEPSLSTEVNSTNNGILTAYEVITLDLKNTDLVVLSACETGLGEIKSGEGVYGLQRAFQVAGAETVIMSLWKVSDEATKKLMTNFYQEWMGGKQKEEAFFAAQKSLRVDFPEPYYWGAFVMLN